MHRFSWNQSQCLQLDPMKLDQMHKPWMWFKQKKSETITFLLQYRTGSLGKFTLLCVVMRNTNLHLGWSQWLGWDRPAPPGRPPCLLRPSARRGRSTTRWLAPAGSLSTPAPTPSLPVSSSSFPLHIVVTSFGWKSSLNSLITVRGAIPPPSLTVQADTTESRALVAFLQCAFRRTLHRRRPNTNCPAAEGPISTPGPLKCCSAMLCSGVARKSPGN